jgi:hypothetical protein
VEKRSDRAPRIRTGKSRNRKSCQRARFIPSPAEPRGS